ncbi:MAG: hypothetical protein P4L71_20200 [Acetobacteraceae bacterium]|nr:hypothetical protein [Acetobacteraceae bacterium]
MLFKSYPEQARIGTDHFVVSHVMCTLLSLEWEERHDAATGECPGGPAMIAGLNRLPWLEARTRRICRGVAIGLVLGGAGWLSLSALLLWIGP